MEKNLITKHLLNRDISWLYFNDRVLQEAQNPEVPKIERVRFLGIFSNNLDEFFRVRVATIKRMIDWGKNIEDILYQDPKSLLAQIQQITVSQQTKFERIYKELFKELEEENIFVLNEKKLNERQLQFAHEYFVEEVRPSLVPIMLDEKRPFPDLKDRSIYLAVKLSKHKDKKDPQYAIIEIPSDLDRIVILPSDKEKKNLILLDDVIRIGVQDIFSVFRYKKMEAYTIKLTRDAELDISEDIAQSFVSKIATSIENRKQGQAVRFVYDKKIPDDLLDFIIKKNDLEPDDNLIPGGRYHNFKDFIRFPDIGAARLRYSKMEPLEHPDLAKSKSMLEVIKRKDVALHFPFQSFDYVIDILREAAIHPNVTSIKMTLYRVANQSKVINALINAAKNGKNVTVVIELQARFDEENNIEWAKILQDEGLKVIFGVPGLKVHSKLILIKTKEGKENTWYAHIGTGNFHEGTAEVYTDVSLFTSNKSIANEVNKVFQFFKDNYKRHTYRQLFVSPTNTRRNFLKQIQNEINLAKKGEKAFIIIKINNLVDEEMVLKLYEASSAGVDIQLIVRGTCSVVPGITGLSDNIRVTSIVDRFLEHTRIFIFGNGGDPSVYISSADWMKRNLDKRIEVTAPILDPRIKNQLMEVVEIYLNDNVKARKIEFSGKNEFVSAEGNPPIRSQLEVYKYYKKLLK